MELKHLQSFVAVVKYGSFTKAAEHLFISQPTISAHISALEEELNKLLIVRTTKSIEITAKGQEVYDYAVNILDLCGRMVSSCREDNRRVIHLGASTIPSAYILPEILPKYGQMYPDTYFVIHQNDSQSVINGLLDGIFDIGMTGMPSMDEKLVCEPFCSDCLVLITPATERFLAMKELPEVPLEELLKEPVILREQGSATNKTADNFLESIGMTGESLHVTARINDQETIKNLVAAGLGISIVSEKAVRNFVEEKRLLQFQLPAHNSRNLYLVYRKNFVLKPHIRDFARFIKEKYS